MRIHFTANIAARAFAAALLTVAALSAGLPAAMPAAAQASRDDQQKRTVASAQDAVNKVTKDAKLRSSFDTAYKQKDTTAVTALLEANGASKDIRVAGFSGPDSPAGLTISIICTARDPWPNMDCTITVK